MSSANPIIMVEYRLAIGFPLYRVGNDGSLWTRIVNAGQSKRVGDHWRRLKGHVNKDGYLVATLYSHLGSKVHTRKVGRLVLEAFVGPRPPGAEVCHFPDPRGTNNSLANIRWGTPAENTEDKRKHGTIVKGSMSFHAKLTEDQIPTIREAISLGEHRLSVAARFGVHPKTIDKIVRRERWKHVQ